MLALVMGLVNSAVNVNTATPQQLTVVKGIGAVRARAIVCHRMTHGEFKSIDDMVHVAGIGPRTLDKVRSVLTTVDWPTLGR